MDKRDRQEFLKDLAEIRKLAQGVRERAGVPVLESCATVPRALDLVTRTPTAGNGIAVMLLDGEGNLASFEKTADRQAVRSPRDGVLFCTNHYVDEEMRRFNDTSCERYRNSTGRYAVLQKALHRDKPAHTVQTMERILKDHSEPGAICQHGTHLYTQYGYLLFPSKRELWVTNGPPCSSRFTLYSIA